MLSPISICPVSNRFVVQSLTAKEIQRMLQLGMRATINSDDPAYFRAYMNENLLALQNEGVSRDELVQLVKNSFAVAWIDDDRRAKYLSQIDEYLQRAA